MLGPFCSFARGIFGSGRLITIMRIAIKTATTVIVNKEEATNCSLMLPELLVPINKVLVLFSVIVTSKITLS